MKYHKCKSYLPFCLAAAFFCSQVWARQPDLDSYRPLPFTLEPVTNHILPVDLNGDDLKDLLIADENQLSVFFQSAGDQPFDFDKPNGTLELPGRATGWAIDKLAGAKGIGLKRLLALVDGKQVIAWPVTDKGFGKADTLIESTSGYLPHGAYPMDFVRDINGDGLNDLLIPGPSELHLHLQTPDGNYAAALRIQSRMMNYARLRLRPDLSTPVGQRIRIPQINIRDVNDDGRNDLVASSEEKLEVFLADPRGRFPRKASYAVDLRELRDSVGEVDFDAVDYSNLSGLLAHTYDLQLKDIDGDEIEDLLIREGGKLTLFGGTPDGMDMEKPRQILKSSGNVLGTTLRDEDEDGLQDLWLMRIEDVSLGNLFLWLAVSGSVDMEIFVYKNRGKRFASRPHRKITVNIKFPSILRSVDIVTAAMEPETDQTPIRIAKAQLDGKTSSEDLALLRDRSLALFVNASSEDGNGSFFGLSGYSRDKDRYVYDLAEVLENPAIAAGYDWDKIDGKQPDLSLAFPENFRPDLNTADLVVRDMNNDGSDDFFVLSERDEKSVSGLLLLSQ